MVHSRDDELKTLALVEAIKVRDLHLISHLVEMGVDINQGIPGTGVACPLSYAVAYNYADVVKYLLEKGGTPNPAILLQVEPSLSAQTLEILSILIAYGIDIDFPLEEGDTLLMIAAWRGVMPFVRLLVESGANVNQINRNGDFALSCAVDTKQRDVYDYLLPLTSPELQDQTVKFLPEDWSKAY